MAYPRRPCFLARKCPFCLSSTIIRERQRYWMPWAAASDWVMAKPIHFSSFITLKKPRSAHSDPSAHTLSQYFPNLLLYLRDLWFPVTFNFQCRYRAGCGFQHFPHKVNIRDDVLVVVFLLNGKSAGWNKSRVLNGLSSKPVCRSGMYTVKGSTGLFTSAVSLFWGRRRQWRSFDHPE